MTTKKRSIFPTKTYSNTKILKHETSIPSIIGNNVTGTVVQGISFGAGSEIGHRAVSAILDNNSSQDKCVNLLNQFNECINKNTKTECEYLLHKYKDCQP